jgi:hypothetical protein
VRSQRVWNEIYTQKYRGYHPYPRSPRYARYRYR